MVGEKYCRHLWYRLMRAAPTSALRRGLLSKIAFVDVAKSVYVGPMVTITPLGGETPEETLLTIGDRVTISPDVSFLCSMHPERANVPGSYGSREPIIIEKDVWIGADSTILNGVTIGEQSIVAAGAIVTEDVPSKTVVGGVPASIIKEYNDEEVL